MASYVYIHIHVCTQLFERPDEPRMGHRSITLALEKGGRSLRSSRPRVLASSQDEGDSEQTGQQASLQGIEMGCPNSLWVALPLKRQCWVI